MTESQVHEPVSDQNHLGLRQLMDPLSDTSHIEADPELELVELGPGEVLIEQGEEGDSAYVLFAGVLGVRVRHQDGTETIIDKLAPGAIVGEMALLSGQKRSATVFAVNDVGLIRLTGPKFEELTKEDQGTATAIDATAQQRRRGLQLAHALSHLVGDLDASSLRTLQKQVAWQRFSAGEVVFKQGDEADCMYIVVNGRLSMSVTDEGGEPRVIGEIGPGEVVGESALSPDDVRVASVHAVCDSRLARIALPVFWRLASARPELMARIARIIVERQQQIVRGG